METRYPQHWRLIRSIPDFMNELSTIPEQDQQRFVEFQIETYAQTYRELGEYIDGSGNGIDRQQAREIARLLHCSFEYREIVSYVYQLREAWPSVTLPFLLAFHDILSLLTDASPSSTAFLQKVRFPELERVFEHRSFAPSLIVKLCDRYESVEEQIRFLDRAREFCYERIQAGALTILDENTNQPVYPTDELYTGFATRIIREVIDSEIVARELVLYFEEREHRKSSTHDYIDPIRWLRGERTLIRLFEDLIRKNLITDPLERIPALIQAHFRNDLNEQFQMEDLVSEMKVKIDSPISPTTTDLIHWNGTESQIVHLILNLEEIQTIWYPKRRHDKYADVIRFHFMNKKGNPFKRKQLSAVKSKVNNSTDDMYSVDARIEQDDLELIDQITERTLE